ncbi:hypothetical protein F5146DRAFT_1126615 [Armillaria mellea]|nr:hypothetical protein F5146DRAFT_1126615 [Armillaria mellea]
MFNVGNPNRKNDKPALPFPDPAQSAAAAPATGKTSSTEEKMRELWSKILPNAPQPLPLKESFFDLGGHSILATRLIFEIRKVFVVDGPLGLVFDELTISGLEPITLPQNDFLGIPQKNIGMIIEYSKVYDQLLLKLHKAYAPLPSRLQFGQFRFEEEEWNRAAEEADAILHVGALVHWVYPYDTPDDERYFNFDRIELASTRKQMLVLYPLSTINTKDYIRLSESLSDSNHQIHQIHLNI